MKLALSHLVETPNSTLSKLTVDGAFCCFVLEDGDRAIKVPGETRIPAGTYAIRFRTHGKFFNAYSKKYRHLFVPELVGVPGFSDILIHMGNWVVDTRGCLLTGMDAGYNPTTNNFYLVAGKSKPAYDRLYKLLYSAKNDGESVEITVHR